METREQLYLSNRPYRIALTVAIVLFLLTLTAAVILLIITSGRDQTLEEQFRVTLTAAFAGVNQTQTALAVSPTPAPTVVYGQFPFAPAVDSPAYSATATCDQQVLAGQVVDDTGSPTDAFDVRAWGDFTPLQTVPTGRVGGNPPGQWSLPLGGMLHRRVWVQLVAGDRHFSAPVEVVFDQTDCARNRAEVVFLQVAPLE